MVRWLSILVTGMAVCLTAIAIVGCGNRDTPSQVVEKMYQLIKENNCQEIANLVNDTYPELADRYVKDCPQIADRLVSYSIKRETITNNFYGATIDGLVAWVEVEVTIKENGEEETNSVKLFLVKRGDDWKLSEAESRS